MRLGMRMLDVAREHEVTSLQLYLTQGEAARLVRELETLLADAEAVDHIHVYGDDSKSEMSVSLVTGRKLETAGYTELERRVLESQ